MLKITEDIFKLFQGNYKPHLSLAYGNYETHQKIDMITIMNELPVKFNANKICLAKNNERNREWEIISSFKFSK